MPNNGDTLRRVKCIAPPQDSVDMSIILNIAQAYTTTPGTHTPPKTTHAPTALAYLAEDSVEFSRAARSLNESMESSSMRLAQINAVRAEIANGTYETPERLEATASRLLDVII
jgi:anti-sigma28 factor (negative regulator of flagellin synthesis)